MVYHQKYVCSIKVGGRILREFDNQGSESSVLLPFNTEYQILAKNLESRPARMKVSIDGKDVLSGNSIIVGPDKSVELNGFMSSNGCITNKFRFIQKTEQIIEYRGDKIDDGVIRISFKFEAPKPIKIDVYEDYHRRDWPKPYWPWPDYWYGPTITYGSGTWKSGTTNNTREMTQCVSNLTVSYCTDSGQIQNMSNVSPLPEEGITTKGTMLHEQYRTGYIGELEPNEHVIIIRLKGTSKVGGEPIAAPVEVKTKVSCPICGTKVKSGDRYCPQCGTCVVEV